MKYLLGTVRNILYLCYLSRMKFRDISHQYLIYLVHFLSEFLIFCVYRCFACWRDYAPCFAVCSVRRGQKKASGPQELELQCWLVATRPRFYRFYRRAASAIALAPQHMSFGVNYHLQEGKNPVHLGCRKLGRQCPHKLEEATDAFSAGPVRLWALL